MTSVELRHGACTDVGLVREVNEDSFLARPPIFVVADGMGGHDGGDVASAIVVEEFARIVDERLDPRRGADLVTATLEVCQERITDYGREQDRAGPHQGHAGTTAVVALLVGDEHESSWLLANLGDSRIYRVDGDDLEQVSVDHSLVQELVDAGTITAEEARTHPERSVITRALGGPHAHDPDFFLLPLATAKRLLLCSDGVSGMLDPTEMADIVCTAEQPGEAAERLVAAAVEAGGRDNATAVVIDVLGWVDDDDPYDSERQRQSLEQKLGALP